MKLNSILALVISFNLIAAPVGSALAGAPPAAALDEAIIKGHCSNPKMRELLAVEDPVTKKKSDEYVVVAHDPVEGNFGIPCSHVGITPSENTSAPCTECEKARATNAPLASKVTGIMDSIGEKLSCSKKSEPPIFRITECGGDALKTIFNVGSFKDLKSILFSEGGQNKAGGNCIENLIKGLVKDIAMMVELAVDVSGWIGKKWDSLFDGDSVKQLEKVSSNAAHLAATATPGLVEQFRAHPWESTKNIFKGIYQMITEGIANNFACEKPDPKNPTKCLEYPESVACANCSTIVNGICGVAGFLTGEVLLAFATGGVANVIGDGAKATAAGAKVIAASKQFSPVRAGLKTIAETISKTPGLKATKNLAVAAGKGTISGAKKVAQSVSQLAAKFAEKTPTLTAGLQATGKAIGKTAGGAYKFSGAKWYIDLNTKAFEAGMYGFKGAQAMRLTRAGEAVAKAEAKAATAVEEMVVAKVELAGLKANGAKGAELAKAQATVDKLDKTAQKSTEAYRTAANKFDELAGPKARVTAGGDGAEAARESAYDFTIVDTSDINDVIRADVRARYVGDIDYMTQLRTAFLEDEKFASLSKARQDDIINSLLTKMEKRLGSADDVKAEITKILNTCGIK